MPRRVKECGGMFTLNSQTSLLMFHLMPRTRSIELSRSRFSNRVERSGPGTACKTYELLDDHLVK